MAEKSPKKVFFGPLIWWLKPRSFFEAKNDLIWLLLRADLMIKCHKWARKVFLEVFSCRLHENTHLV
jgi:hypothetical protein